MSITKITSIVLFLCCISSCVSSSLDTHVRECLFFGNVTSYTQAGSAVKFDCKPVE